MKSARVGDPATITLIVALALAALIALATTVSGGLQRRVLRQHHLRPSSAASWMVLALVPRMYGGRHEAWLSPEPLGDHLAANPALAPFPVEHLWVNHYPARLVRLDTARAALAEAPAGAHLRLVSSYRGATLTTRWRLRVERGRLRVTRAP